MDGVLDATVTFSNATAEVYGSSALSLQDLLDAVDAVGFSASLFSDHKATSVMKQRLSWKSNTVVNIDPLSKYFILRET